MMQPLRLFGLCRIAFIALLILLLIVTEKDRR